MEKSTKRSGVADDHTATGEEIHSRIIRQRQAPKVEETRPLKTALQRGSLACLHPRKGYTLKVAARGAVPAHSRMNWGAL